MWVLARDLDRVRLFRRPLDGYGLGTPVELRPADGQQNPPPDLPELPDLRRGDLEAAPGPGGGLALTATGEDGVTRVWLADREGRTRPAAALAGLPLGHAPAVAPGGGSPPVLFAADTAHAQTPGPATPLTGGGGWLNFPALLRLGDAGAEDAVLASDRGALAAPADVAILRAQPASPRAGGAEPFGRLRPADGPCPAV